MLRIVQRILTLNEFVARRANVTMSIVRVSHGVQEIGCSIECKYAQTNISK